MNISVNDLVVKFNKKVILDRMSVKFPDGWVSVICGGNGSGKSTLLKTVAGLVKNSGGSVTYDNCDVKTFSPCHLARKRSVLLQNPSFPAAMRAGELLKLGRYAFSAGKKADECAIFQALSDAGCEDLVDRQLGTLSGGELRKVFLALTLAQEPELLLLDEPEAGLDAGFCSAFPALLKKLVSERKLTVIMVMHNLDLALQCADKLVLLENGRAVLDMPVNEAGFREKLTDITGKYLEIFTGESGILRAIARY